MKNIFLTFVLLFAFGFAESQAEAKAILQSEKEAEDARGKLLTEELYNHVRVFPLKYFQSAWHLGYERRLSEVIWIGVEGQVMGSYTSSFFLGDLYYRVRENYYGPLLQWHFKPGPGGFYIEAGANFMTVDIVDDSTTLSSTGKYTMYHATVNYRIVSQSGFTFNFGGGYMQFIGTPASYTGFLNEKREGPYQNGQTNFRTRFDVGYAF